MKSESKPGRPKGTRDYIRERNKRAEYLFVREGLECREIAALMMEEGTLKSESVDSAQRVIRGIIAPLRRRISEARKGDASETVATSEIDALERKLGRLRAEYGRQQIIADGQPMELCARSSLPLAACANLLCRDEGHAPYVGPGIGMTMLTTPQGPIVSYKALWPAGVRQKASKDAARLAMQIADLEMEIATRRDEQITAGDAGGAPGLTLIESDKPIAELIRENLIVGSFGKKTRNSGSGGAAATP